MFVHVRAFGRIGVAAKVPDGTLVGRVDGRICYFPFMLTRYGRLWDTKTGVSAQPHEFLGASR